MASLAANHPRHHGPRLFEGPLLFRRVRGSIYELVALVWFATEVVRFVRARIEAPGRGRGRTPMKERLRWKQ